MASNTHQNLADELQRGAPPLSSAHWTAPPTEVEVCDHDDASAITGMHTIDYAMQNSMYPSAADVLHFTEDAPPNEEQQVAGATRKVLPLESSTIKTKISPVASDEPESTRQQQEQPLPPLTTKSADTAKNENPRTQATRGSPNSQAKEQRQKTNSPDTRINKDVSPSQQNQTNSLNEWMAGFSVGIQSMPALPPPSNVRYDARGQVLKSSVMTDSRVGAHAIDGPGAKDSHLFMEENGGNNNEVTTDDIDEEANNESSESELHKSKGISWWQQRRVYILIAILLGIMVVAVVVGLLLGGSSDGPEDLQTPQKEETRQNKFDLTLVPNLADSTVQALEDPFSIQYRAYEWITRDDNWETYEDWQKQQRFAMVCLYYAFGGGHGSGWFLSRTHHAFHECDWDRNTDLCPNEDGIVTTLSPKRSASQPAFLPPELALFSNLEVLDFYDLKWTLPLEDMLPHNTTSNLPLLRELRFVKGQIKGIIPSSLGLLTSLEHLDLSKNQLSSTIPSQLGLLSNLQTLVLSSNNLSGSIPKELEDLSSLTTIDLEDNPGVEL